MSKRRSSRKKIKKETKKNLVAAIVIIIIMIGGYFYIKDVEWMERTLNASRTGNELYITLENKDSLKYIANIELGKNTNILILSEIFYKDKVFWPYIFEENSKIANPLDIPKGTIVHIPKISTQLLDITSEKNLERAKFLGDSILDVIQESRKAKPLEN